MWLAIQLASASPSLQLTMRTVAPRSRTATSCLGWRFLFAAMTALARSSTLATDL